MNAQERRSVASLASLYMFRMLGLFMVLPLLALYAADMDGATPFLIGLALGIYGLTQALLQIPFGWLSDWLGRKPVIIGGLLLFALGSVIAAQADTVQGIILGRTLQGAGAIASTVMALVADLTRPEQRTKAMALVGMSIGASFVIALVLGPAVAGVGGLSAVFWFTALLALAGIAIVVFRVPTPSSPGGLHNDVGARWELIGRSLGDRSLGRLNFGVFTLHFVLMACFLIVPGFLEATAGIDRAYHWQVYLPALLLSLLGMAPLMAMAERGGKPRHAFLLALTALLASVGVLGAAGSSAVFYGGLWLFFVGFNYMEATLPSVVSKTVFAGGRGTAMGVFSTSQFLGAFAGGAVGGALLQHYGQGVLVATCLALLLLWVVSVLRAPAFPPAVDEAVPSPEG